MANEIQSKMESTSIQENYSLILNKFFEKYGRHTVLIDSSKDIEALKILSKIPDINIKVIFLVRDVRSWTTSRLDTRYRNPNYFLKGGYVERLSARYHNKIFLKIIQFLVPFITKQSFYYFLIWQMQNKQMLSFLRNSKLSYFQLGYEELCLNTDQILGKLFKFLDIATSEERLSYSLKTTKSHILFGNNPKKSDSRRRKAIFYDHRWLHRNEYLFPSIVFPNIMKLNSNLVYSNIKKNSIW